MEPGGSDGGNGAARAERRPAPSAFDDLATVWASYLARRPVAWALGLWLVATAAVGGEMPGAEVLVVVAAAVAAHRFADWTGPRALIGVLSATVLPAVLFCTSNEAPGELGLRWTIDYAAGVTTAAIVRGRLRVPRVIGVAGAVVCAVVAALSMAHAWFAVLALFAVLTAAIALRGSLLWALCAAATGAVVQLALTFAPIVRFAGGWAIAAIFVRGIEALAVWGALVVVLRAVAREAHPPGAADAASARLVIRIRRAPWRTALVGCTLGAAFQPAQAVTGSLLSAAHVYVFLPSIAVSSAFVALMAVSERGLWGVGRFLVAATLALAVSVGVTVLTSGASAYASAPSGDVAMIAAGPWVYLGVAWFAGRRDSAGEPGIYAVIAAIVASLLALNVALVGNRLGAEFLFASLLSHLAWLVLFHRLATCARSGRALPLAWVVANAACAVCALAWDSIGGGGEWFGLVTELRIDGESSAPPAVVACVFAAAAMNTLHGAMWVLAARRIRSMTVIPETHRLRADWAVDLHGPPHGTREG